MFYRAHSVDDKDLRALVFVPPEDDGINKLNILVKLLEARLFNMEVESWYLEPEPSFDLWETLAAFGTPRYCVRRIDREGSLIAPKNLELVRFADGE